MDSLLLDFDEVARLIVFSPATVANWAYRRKPAPQGFSGREDGPRPPRSPDRSKAEADNFLWGRHPVLAALANPARRGTGRLIVTAERAQEIEDRSEAL